MVVMNVTLKDISRAFDELCAETCSREQISKLAVKAIEADDLGVLNMEKPHDDKIWKSIIYLSGVDMKTDEENYLHSISDFLKARKTLEV